ncbi:MAG: hypothetical protein N2318_04660 [Meiothermus sp.]|jgi:hypothetical protein|nr:hypothetical protein [Meiothermus sp.]
MKHALLLPANIRPITLEPPHQPARAVGLAMRLLRLEALDQVNTPGSPAAMAKLLAGGSCAPRDAGGGIIPARRVPHSLEMAHGNALWRKTNRPSA